MDQEMQPLAPAETMSRESAAYNLMNAYNQYLNTLTGEERIRYIRLLPPDIIARASFIDQLQWDPQWEKNITGKISNALYHIVETHLQLLKNAKKQVEHAFGRILTLREQVDKFKKEREDMSHFHPLKRSHLSSVVADIEQNIQILRYALQAIKHLVAVPPPEEEEEFIESITYCSQPHTPNLRHILIPLYRQQSNGDLSVQEFNQRVREVRQQHQTPPVHGKEHAG